MFFVGFLVACHLVDCTTRERCFYEQSEEERHHFDLESPRGDRVVINNFRSQSHPGVRMMVGSYMAKPSRKKMAAKEEA